MKPLLARMFIPSAMWLVLTLTAPTLWGEDTERSLDRRDRSVEVEAKLSGFQEVPPILSDGRGRFDAIIHQDNKSITFRLSYSGLSSPVTRAHIHFGQKGVNGAIVVFLCPGGSGPAECPPSGTITGTITGEDVIAVPAQGVMAGDLAGVIRAIRNGAAYVNVHTTTFGGGEIRGQLRVDED
jgi:CHRD domain